MVFSGWKFGDGLAPIVLRYGGRDPLLATWFRVRYDFAEVLKKTRSCQEIICKTISYLQCPSLKSYSSRIRHFLNPEEIYDRNILFMYKLLWTLTWFCPQVPHIELLIWHYLKPYKCQILYRQQHNMILSKISSRQYFKILQYNKSVDHGPLLDLRTYQPQQCIGNDRRCSSKGPPLQRFLYSWGQRQTPSWSRPGRRW